MIKKIMIVDDSDLLHKMYEIVLSTYKNNGTEFIHCFNGKDALEKLSKNSDTNLIILDINMPVMSGLEFLQYCRDNKVFTHIPVIIISTEGSKEDTLRGLKAGAKAYITKPFKPDELRAIITRVLL